MFIQKKRKRNEQKHTSNSLRKELSWSTVIICVELKCPSEKDVQDRSGH